MQVSLIVMDKAELNAFAYIFVFVNMLGTFFGDTGYGMGWNRFFHSYQRSCSGCGLLLRISYTNES
jgi:hypothetical protein